MSQIAIRATQPRSLFKITRDRETFVGQVDLLPNLEVLDTKQFVVRNSPLGSGSVFCDSENNSEGFSIGFANWEELSVIEYGEAAVHSDPQSATVVFRHRGNVAAGQAMICAD